MKYKIVHEQGTDRFEVASVLEKRVNSLLENHWKPQGGLSVSTEMHGYTAWYTMCQAMVKLE